MKVGIERSAWRSFAQHERPMVRLKQALTVQLTRRGYQRLGAELLFGRTAVYAVTARNALKAYPWDLQEYTDARE